MKKLLLILGMSLGLGSTASADTVWTFVDLLLLDDYRKNLNLKLFSNKKDCRSAAIEEFIKVTSQNEGIKVIENRLNHEILINATLVDEKVTMEMLGCIILPCSINQDFHLNETSDATIFGPRDWNISSYKKP